MPHVLQRAQDTGEPIMVAFAMSVDVQHTMLMLGVNWAAQRLGNIVCCNPMQEGRPGQVSIGVKPEYAVRRSRREGSCDILLWSRLGD